MWSTWWLETDLENDTDFARNLCLGAFSDFTVSDEKNFSEGEKVWLVCSKESKVPVDLEVGLDGGDCVKEWGNPDNDAAK